MEGGGVDAQWHEVCGIDDIWPDTGVCAWIGGRQIAVFRLAAGEVYAIDNHDPCSGANVLSRGLVGNLGDRIVVASPIYKQHFDLATGACIENTEQAVRSYPARVTDSRVWVAV